MFSRNRMPQLATCLTPQANRNGWEEGRHAVKGMGKCSSQKSALSRSPLTHVPNEVGGIRIQPMTNLGNLEQEAWSSIEGFLGSSGQKLCISSDVK